MRSNIISRAIEECLKDLYSYAKPHIEWDDFLLENKIYNTKKEGPAPFEFYYLPKEILENIVESYAAAYNLDKQQNLLDTIEILKEYCKNPIVTKYIAGENGNPGYRGYDHPDNLEKQLTDLIPDSGFSKSDIAESIQNKFFEFLDMAGKFFNWNRDLNAFNTTIYLGVSPCSNKETVIKNWKKYRKQDIEIDESKYKENDDYDE
jgi:hypothetical protein